MIDFLIGGIVAMCCFCAVFYIVKTKINARKNGCSGCIGCGGNKGCCDCGKN